VRLDFHLLFSALFMLLGVVQLGVVIGVAHVPRSGNAAGLSAAMLSVTVLGACFGYRSLIRAVDRGYSQATSSLAAVLLLLGAFPTLYWIWALATIVTSKS
jgi:hypothetical protein